LLPGCRVSVLLFQSPAVAAANKNNRLGLAVHFRYISRVFIDPYRWNTAFEDNKKQAKQYGYL
jgi:hypothetical protein